MAQVKTKEIFIKEVYDLVKDEYTIIGEYKNNKEKILIRHNLCNYEYYVSPNKFLSQNRRCPKCNGGISYDDSIFLKKVYNLVKDEYVFLEKYNGNDKYLRCKHNISSCNYEWNITPHHFLAGIRCPKCANNIKKSNDQFINEVILKRGDSYIVKGKYINNNTPIEIFHKNCEKSWNVIPVKFLAGRSCPYCIDRTNSRNTILIKEWLNKNNIIFETEKTFNDCRYKGKLYFDFFIPSKYILIEYDGEFHYKAYGKNEESLIKTQKRDKIKDDYILNKKGFYLYRISYKDDIEKELTKIFK